VYRNILHSHAQCMFLFWHCIGYFDLTLVFVSIIHFIFIQLFCDIKYSSQSLCSKLNLCRFYLHEVSGYKTLLQVWADAQVGKVTYLRRGYSAAEKRPSVHRARPSTHAPARQCRPTSPYVVALVSVTDWERPASRVVADDWLSPPRLVARRRNGLLINLKRCGRPALITGTLTVGARTPALLIRINACDLAISSIFN